jgi:hypothetical protein
MKHDICITFPVRCSDDMESSNFLYFYFYVKFIHVQTRWEREPRLDLWMACSFQLKFNHIYDRASGVPHDNTKNGNYFRIINLHLNFCKNTSMFSTNYISDRVYSCFGFTAKDAMAGPLRIETLFGTTF